MKFIKRKIKSWLKDWLEIKDSKEIKTEELSLAFSSGYRVGYAKGKRDYTNNFKGGR